jgi:hypothetical protein
MVQMEQPADFELALRAVWLAREEWHEGDRAWRCLPQMRQPYSARVMKPAAALEPAVRQALQRLQLAALRPLVRVRLCGDVERRFRRLTQRPLVSARAAARRWFHGDDAWQSLARRRVHVFHAPNEREFEQPDHRSMD